MGGGAAAAHRARARRHPLRARPRGGDGPPRRAHRGELLEHPHAADAREAPLGVQRAARRARAHRRAALVVGWRGVHAVGRDLVSPREPAGGRCRRVTRSSRCRSTHRPSRSTCASRAMGLRDVAAIRTHRNRSVLVSLTRRGVLRVHADYAGAPDHVIAAIVRFLRRGVPLGRAAAPARDHCARGRCRRRRGRGGGRPRRRRRRPMRACWRSSRHAGTSSTRCISRAACARSRSASRAGCGAGWATWCSTAAPARRSRSCCGAASCTARPGRRWRRRCCTRWCTSGRRRRVGRWTTAGSSAARRARWGSRRGPWPTWWPDPGPVTRPPARRYVCRSPRLDTVTRPA
ncbi:MAG: hypothetical protein MZV64_32270 [Ignavibacteriales bacterium]|nr:hypothetical protein [Ignavibacteriales bacterium]